MSFQTREAFLLDLLNYFTTDTTRRCIFGGRCVYSPVGHPTGSEGCAIGRHLDADLQVRLDSREDGVGVSNLDVFKQLPQWMKELGKEFLTSCQGLHDDETSWGNNKLSPYGRSSVNDIVYKYGLAISAEELNKFGVDETPKW